MLTAPWVRDHTDDFDVLHLHFGAESFPLDELEAFLAELNRAGKPFVYTVHDLENPQLRDQAGHLAMLDLVIPRATALTTLTPGAAEHVEDVWQRRPAVIPHPPLAMDGRDRDSPSDGRPSGRVIGTHLRDLRPNIDAIGTVTTLIRSVRAVEHAGGRLRAVVRMNEHVRDERTAAVVEDLVRSTEGVTLERQPRLTDLELLRSLSDLDVCVLPYRFGTHSGWVELCYDLGVPVAGPSRGHFREQHSEEYATFDLGDPVSLVRAVERLTEPAASTSGSPERAKTVAERRNVRAAVAADIRDAHTRLYREVSGVAA